MQYKLPGVPVEADTPGYNEHGVPLHACYGTICNEHYFAWCRFQSLRMKIKTSELTGTALDWAVAKCEGMSDDMLNTFEDGEWLYMARRYSTSWAQGGPIIEREFFALTHYHNGDRWTWVATTAPYVRPTKHGTGLTPLVAAMRAYVTSRLGDEVEIPKELI